MDAELLSNFSQLPTKSAKLASYPDNGLGQDLAFAACTLALIGHILFARDRLQMVRVATGAAMTFVTSLEAFRHFTMSGAESDSMRLIRPAIMPEIAIAAAV